MAIEDLFEKLSLNSQQTIEYAEKLDFNNVLALQTYMNCFVGQARDPLEYKEKFDINAYEFDPEESLVREKKGDKYLYTNFTTMPLVPALKHNNFDVSNALEHYPEFQHLVKNHHHYVCCLSIAVQQNSTTKQPFFVYTLNSEPVNVNPNAPYFVGEYFNKTIVPIFEEVVNELSKEKNKEDMEDKVIQKWKEPSKQKNRRYNYSTKLLVKPDSSRLSGSVLDASVLRKFNFMTLGRKLNYTRTSKLSKVAPIQLRVDSDNEIIYPQFHEFLGFPIIGAGSYTISEAKCQPELWLNEFIVIDN